MLLSLQQTHHSLKLAQALQEARLQPEAPLLVMELEGMALAFPRLQLLFREVAQGSLLGPEGPQHWMAAFCPVCDAGSYHQATVEGRLLHFKPIGMYNAAMLLGDEETQSEWDHIQGLCIAGPLAGKSLQRLGDLASMTAAQTLLHHPEATLIFLPIAPGEEAESQEFEDFNLKPDLDLFQKSLTGPADPRLARLEIGLGLWGKSGARYYPLKHLHAQDNALLDAWEGQTILLVIDPETASPNAFYTSAKRFEWRNEVLYLDTGEEVRAGRLYRGGQLQAFPPRPRQIFVRWYAFAYRFPSCQIYTP
jgi:hypothetical protein